MTDKALSFVRRNNPAAARALKAGWMVRWLGSGHLRWTCPHGCCTFTGASTPGRPHGAMQRLDRAVRNCPQLTNQEN